MPITRNLNVELAGRGKVVLRPTNYVTTGGEASIYRLTDTIVKIFTDPDKMRIDRMVEKVNRLAKSQHKFIVSPRGVVEDDKHNPIGYYMGFAEGEPMSRVFTTAFRQRDGFTDKDAVQLVHNMREAVDFAHQSVGAVLVDANELNWLMFRSPEAEPRIVDVDSWQIMPQWPARVIMPSIRDYHSHNFNEQTDWFSWGIVSFQVFTGIHPYKGRHNDYKPNELERRMRDNVSVFDKNVHLNAAVRDFSCIPGPLLDWYERTFQSISRERPPSPLDGHTRTVTRAKVTVTATGSLVFEMILGSDSNPVVRVYPCGLALRQSGSINDLLTKRFLPQIVHLGGTPLSPHTEIVRAASGYLVADQGRFYYLSATEQSELSLTMNTYGIVSNADRMFAITDQGLTELKLLDMGNKRILTVGQTWATLRLSTEWFDGVGVQNALGAKHLVVPFSSDSCGFVRVAELDDMTVVSARAGYRFVSVIAVNKAGEYKKLEFCLDHAHSKYTVWVGDADNPDINLAVLPSGICATIVKDGELSIFVPANGNVRNVLDKTIDTSMQLGTWGDKVVYIKDGEVHWVRLK